MALTIASNKTKKAGFIAGVVTAIFAVAMQPILASGLVGAIVINELMPNPQVVADSAGEWVEVRNPSSEPKDVSGWTVSDDTNVLYTFPAATVLAPQQLYVICATDPTDGVVCDDEWAGSNRLDNNGDTITLRDSSASVVDQVVYAASDVDDGKSIEVVREDNTQTLVQNDTDTYNTHSTDGSKTDNGTPGAANAAQADSAVVNTDTGENFSNLQAAIDDGDTDDGETLQLQQNMTTAAQVTVDKELTIDGGGFELDAAFAKTDNSNNSAIGVQADNVVVKNISLTSSADVPWPGQLHGINVYEADNVLVEDVTAYGFEGTGIAYNSSTGVIRNVDTYNNGWHGINVDKRTSMPANVTVEGSNTHNEAFADIYVDDDRIVTLKAPAYSWERSGRPNTGRDYTQDRVYRLSDPNDSHQLTLSGTIYRDRAVDDCDNRSECLAQPVNNELEGWEVRLYKENETGDWVYVKSATSNQDGVYKLGSPKTARHLPCL